MRDVNVQPHATASALAASLRNSSASIHWLAFSEWYPEFGRAQGGCQNTRRLAGMIRIQPVDAT